VRGRWAAVALTTSARRAFGSRTSLLALSVLYLVIAGTMGALWRVAASGNGGSIAGYTGLQLTWYLAVAEAVTVSLHSRLIERIGDDVADGAVAVELLRPASVVGVRLASELGSCLPRLAVTAAFGVGLATITGGAPAAGLGLVLAVPSMLLAVSANLAAQHAVAALSFWSRDARSAWFLYQKLVFILGGMLIPIQLLPPGLRSICSCLPFISMAYAPARLAAGFVEPQLLALQLGWLVVLLAAAVLAFRAGERRLQVVGG
jgi:ABC-2 type transport system permease protein